MLPPFMIRQVAASQDALLERLLDDDRFLRRMAAHPQHARLSAHLPAGRGHVLELGCGPGKYVAMLARLGFRVTGVDPIPFPTWDVLRRKSDAELRDGVFAEELPFADRAFDHVVCLGTLLYVRDPERSIDEMLRVVKPGGRIILRTVNRLNAYTRRTGRVLDPASKNLYTMGELAALLQRRGVAVDDRLAYGFLPPAYTNLWWYLVCVWIPMAVQDWLSDRVAPDHRWNNTVFATAPVR